MSYFLYRCSFNRLNYISHSSQLLNKIFHIVDTTLVKQDVEVAQYHFNSEFTTRAPLILDGKPILFESFQNHVVLGRKPMPPYVDGELKAELLSKPLPSIYPLSRTVSIHGRNIYRLETKFRKFTRNKFVLFVLFIDILDDVFHSRPTRSSAGSTDDGYLSYQPAFPEIHRDSSTSSTAAPFFRCRQCLRATALRCKDNIELID